MKWYKTAFVNTHRVIVQLASKSMSAERSGHNGYSHDIAPIALQFIVLMDSYPNRVGRNAVHRQYEIGFALSVQRWRQVKIDLISPAN